MSYYNIFAIFRHKNQQIVLGKLVLPAHNNIAGVFGLTKKFLNLCAARRVRKNKSAIQREQRQFNFVDLFFRICVEMNEFDFSFINFHFA